MRRRSVDLTRLGGVVGAFAIGLVATACGGDGRELADARVPAPRTTVAETTLTASTPPGSVRAVPSTDTAPTQITIELLSSPDNAIGAVTGSGAVATDPVTVDGQPGDVVSFEVGADGSFEMRVFIPDEGAHTVCVADACGRVYTLAPDAESAPEVIAKIDEAVALAGQIAPLDAWFPDWTIEIGGLLSGTGGTTDVERGVVTVYRNRGRTVDDFVRTILHEYGHVADHEWLDDEARAEFGALRGFAPGAVWRADGTRLDDWVAAPSEDFAEVMAALWSDGRWSVRTDGGPLDEPVRAFLSDLVPPPD